MCYQVARDMVSVETQKYEEQVKDLHALLHESNEDRKLLSEHVNQLIGEKAMLEFQLQQIEQQKLQFEEILTHKEHQLAQRDFELRSMQRNFGIDAPSGTDAQVPNITLPSNTDLRSTIQSGAIDQSQLALDSRVLEDVARRHADELPVQRPIRDTSQVKDDLPALAPTPKVSAVQQMAAVAFPKNGLGDPGIGIRAPIPPTSAPSKVVVRTPVVPQPQPQLVTAQSVPSEPQVNVASPNRFHLLRSQPKVTNHAPSIYVPLAGSVDVNRGPSEARPVPVAGTVPFGETSGAEPLNHSSLASDNTVLPQEASLHTLGSAGSVPQMKDKRDDADTIARIHRLHSYSNYINFSIYSQITTN